MRDEFAVDYLYEGEWIEFAKHPTYRLAQRDANLLSLEYKTRIRELNPQRCDG